MPSTLLRGSGSPATARRLATIRGSGGAARGLRSLASARWLAAAALAFALVAHPASAQDAVDPRVDLDAVVAELEPEIRRAMVEGRIPSVTIALTAGEEVLWARGYGESNLAARTPATPNTVYIIASTLKTMGATALMQLMEEGHFELDDPVRDFIGDLEIRDEDPDDPVTFRHLLTHTSGLPTIFSGVPVWADTVPTPKHEYLARELRVAGPPGERVRYSNMAFTLIAQIIEEITGEDFRDVVRDRLWEPLGMSSTAFAPSPEMQERFAIPYRPDSETGAQRPISRVRFAEWPAGGVWGTVQDRLWEPLGMSSTAFAPTPEMQERFAIPYRPDSETGAQRPVSRVRFAEWPAGGVWGTVQDQARWMIAALNGGSFRGTSILSPETVELMQTPSSDRFNGPMAGGWGGEEGAYGLAWWTTTRGGERYIAHSGSVGGYTAFIHGNRDRRLGVVILTNGQRAHPHLVRLSFLATDLMAEHGGPVMAGGGG